MHGALRCVALFLLLWSACASSQLRFDAPFPHHRVRHSHRQARAPAHQRNRAWNACPLVDLTMKAYTADAVVIARTEAVRFARSLRQRYSVYFKVQQVIKTPATIPRVDNYLQVFFANETSGRCSWPPAWPIRANIQQGKEYILFLKANGAHNYTPSSVPELVRRRRPSQPLMRVTSPEFKVKPPRVEPIKKKVVDNSNNRKPRLKLICKTMGLPIPTLSWTRNGTAIQLNSRFKISYKKRRSMLVIVEPDWKDRGRYECRAHGVHNLTSKAHWDLTSNDIQHRDKSVHSEKFEATVRECEPDMANYYCYNGGTCHYVTKMKEIFCVCPDGYTGQRCDSKLPSQSSMYPPTTPLYTCKVGLSTRYFC